MSSPSTTGVQRITITEAQDGQRLDNFLTTFLKGVPKSHIYKILRSGEVRVNSGRVKAATRLNAGDQVRIPPMAQSAAAFAGVPGEEGAPPVPTRQLEVLRQCVVFEDEAMIVLNKPSGMAVHGGSGVSFGVIELARVLWPDDSKLELVHRLDRDTSGLLLLARTRSALLSLQRQLQDGGIGKEYQALCVGRWPKHLRVIDAPLQRDQLRSGERMVRVAQGGKASESRFRILENFKVATLMAVTLISGRTHQIRVHAQLAGHPLVGDEKYGDNAANKELRALGCKRLFLHAWRLSFRHPISGDAVELEAPLPPELQSALDQIRESR